MRKKLLFAFATALIATLIVATPAFAFNGIDFHVYDAVTLDPWGTTAGQSYRIFVWGSVQGQLLDTTVLTTPTDPVLDFTCAYGGACPPGYATTLIQPNLGEVVTVYIILSGTVDDPSTIVSSFQQPPNLGVPFVISQNSGTGPNAVTLAGANAQSPSQWLLAALAAVALVGVGGAVLLLRRRQIA
jgi:hypothetical protein